MLHLGYLVPLLFQWLIVTLVLVIDSADVNDEKWFELASNVFARRTKTYDNVSDWIEPWWE